MFAVVTGAASGIGREVALQLAERGYAVAVSDRDAEGLHVERDGAHLPAFGARGDGARSRGVLDPVRRIDSADEIAEPDDPAVDERARRAEADLCRVRSGEPRRGVDKGVTQRETC